MNVCFIDTMTAGCAAGAWIVTEQWVSESKRRNTLLDVAPYEWSSEALEAATAPTTTAPVDPTSLVSGE